MPRIPLPDGCAGFADGDRKFMARHGAGGPFVHLDETDPVEAKALRKLRNQDYASAGLVDAGAEKFYTRRAGDGRWCRSCNRVWNRWNQTCPRPECGQPTVPESEMPRDLPAGPHMPFGPVASTTF